MKDVIINKVQSIHRCIERAREEYKLAGKTFDSDYTHQDAAILNIIRACEQAIDLANHVIKSHQMGIPASNAESFSLLAQKQVISRDIEQKMIRMTGFRNMAVHQYQRLDMIIVEAIIVSNLDDLLHYTEAIMRYVD